MTSTLNNAHGGALRFSVDVSCGSSNKQLVGNCLLLGISGVNRIMNMATYNAGYYAAWYHALRSALDAPLDALGVGQSSCMSRMSQAARESFYGTHLPVIGKKSPMSLVVSVVLMSIVEMWLRTASPLSNG